MSNKKTYAVLGLGRYGKAVAKELALNGADVIGVDIDESAVEEAAAYLPICKGADASDPEVMAALGIKNADVVVIAMAGKFEASIMIAMLCKDSGVKTVIAKCKNEKHAEILEKIGVDKTVFPEKESGIRLAKNMLSSGFIDMAELAEGISVVELNIRQEWKDKSLKELKLREKYGINVIAVIKGGEVNTLVDPSMPISSFDKLIVIAETEKLGKLK